MFSDETATYLAKAWSKADRSGNLSRSRLQTPFSRLLDKLHLHLEFELNKGVSSRERRSLHVLSTWPEIKKGHRHHLRNQPILCIRVNEGMTSISCHSNVMRPPLEEKLREFLHSKSMKLAMKYAVTIVVCDGEIVLDANRSEHMSCLGANFLPNLANVHTWSPAILIGCEYVGRDGESCFNCQRRKASIPYSGFG